MIFFFFWKDSLVQVPLRMPDGFRILSEERFHILKSYGEHRGRNSGVFCLTSINDHSIYFPRICVVLEMYRNCFFIRSNYIYIHIAFSHFLILNINLGQRKMTPMN